MTMIDAVLMNGAQYLCSLGLLAMAWGWLQRREVTHERGFDSAHGS